MRLPQLLRRRNAHYHSDCKNDKTSKVTIDLVDNSPYHLIGAFDGPEGTPYEGGHFEVVRARTRSPHTRIGHSPRHRTS